ncbi:MAG: vitamin B12 dependent-methionine synthase activation domain-containing protein, partial [Candidatus Neomarinimicrobiota bacterium]
NIFPLADRMALFAITMGHEICTVIESLFKNNDYVLGYMLDTVASLGADNAAGIMENQYGNMNSGNSEKSLVLGYSPGYCGWHLSGQKKLFGRLKPETIGISLNTSYLMQPLKSVTGILVQGNSNIHKFIPDFPFCRVCRTHSCNGRLKYLTSIDKGIN